VNNKIDVSELRGPLSEFLDQLSGDSAQERFKEFKLWQKRVKSQPLRPEATVGVAAVRRFVAREHLAAANIGQTGENFERLFLDKVEENVPAGRIAVQTLLKGSLDFEIEAEVGRARRVTHLAHFFQLMKKQSKGQAGPLLTSGGPNFAYIFGNDGKIWATYAGWLSFFRYWSVEAYSVGPPRVWDPGSRVLSQAA